MKTTVSITYTHHISLSLVIAAGCIIPASPLLAGTLDGAHSAADDSVAIGSDARANGINAVAVGDNSFAGGQYSISIGSTSNANSIQSTTLGALALADQPQATAVGSFAQVIGEASSAFGGSAFAEAEQASALGANTIAEAQGGTAVGNQAYVTATAQHAVALGYQSVATEANTVSVGDTVNGITRRITNVAPAQHESDAVNLGQFQQGLDTVNARLQNGLNNVRDEAFAGIAAAAAFNPATPSAPGKTAVSLGAANYRGEQAVAVSFSHRLSDNRYNTAIQGGVSYDSGEHALGKVGVSWEF